MSLGRASGADRPWNGRRVIAARLLIAGASAPTILNLASGATPSRDACLALLAAYAVACTVALAASDRTGPAARAVAVALPALDVVTFAALLLATGSYRGPTLVGFIVAVVAFSRDAGARTGVGVAAFVAAGVTSVAFDKSAPALSAANVGVCAESFFVFTLTSALAAWASADGWRRRLPDFESTVYGAATRATEVGAVARALVGGARELFDSDRALLVLAEPDGERVTVYRDAGEASSSAESVETVGGELADRLLLTPSPHALLVGRASARSRRLRDAVFDVGTGRRVAEHGYDLEALGGLLDAAAFLSLPVRSRSGARGRLYVVWSKPRRISRDELFALRDALGVVGATLDAIRRAERAETAAAVRERVRIARDLHDTTVQSFVGLQMGLTAVQRKIAAGSAEIAGDVARLLSLAETEIGETRGYLDGLRYGGESSSGLLESVTRFVEKFRGATGIDVSVRAEGDVELDEPLAADVFRVVAEGLSNVRRHTRSRWAVVELRRSDARFDVRITNDASDGEPARPFTPRSIGERAAALGGDLHVSILKNGSTRIRVAIPLPARSTGTP